MRYDFTQMAPGPLPPPFSGKGWRLAQTALIAEVLRGWRAV